jgi:hypothetical protein
MSTHRGNDGKVKIGANAVAEITGWSLSQRAATMDDSAIGDAWDTHLTGSKSWEAEISCWWDETDTNGQVLMTPDASVSLVLLPEGDDSGDASYTGTATVVEISQEIRRNQTVSVTFRCQGNGALALSTV